jgi:hypothetical protein
MCIATHHAAARLACVRHAASVQSEPGSNSSINSQSYQISEMNPDRELTSSKSRTLINQWVASNPVTRVPTQVT